MKEKKFIKMHMPHAIAVFFMLMFCVMGMMTGTKVQAAEYNNPAYTFMSTKDASISTTANPGQTTVLIFGHTRCGYTRETLNSIASCNWVHRSDIRVIFAETNGHSKEEVISYEEGYQCEEMISCYDEDYGIPDAMIAYLSLFGAGMDGEYPVIALIDKNNKARSLSMGQKTADEILAEIKKFENIDESGGTTPPAGSGEGYENFAYGLKTIDGATISTKANPNETTVLLFGNTGCPVTAGTLAEIDKSSWVNRSDIRVIYADLYGASKSKTEEFAKNYPGGKIIFCHDEAYLNFNHGMMYIGLENHTQGAFPFIIIIDKYNRVRKITLGYKSADEIIQEIEKINKADQSGGNQNSTDGQSVSDVTGLSAASTAKNVTLTWNAVSGAAGYEVYQYNQTKKAWETKVTLLPGEVSYTIKGLTPAKEYRFSVRAFVKPEGKGTVYSKTYVSVDTATAPKSVNFKVKAGKKKAIIRWNKVKGADGYTVLYKTKAKGSWKKLKNIKKTSYTKTKLKSGKTYYFTVKAYKKYKGQTYTGSFKTKKVKIK